MSESISSVELALGGKAYKLLGDWAALQRLERYFGGMPWYQVVAKCQTGLTIDETGKVLSALSVERDVEPKTFIRAMAGPKGQLAALKGIKEAIREALPAPDENAEGGGNADADPQ